MKKVAIFASGSGTNAENISIYFSGNQQIEVTLLVSNNPKAGVHERMSRLGIPSVTFPKQVFAEGHPVLKKLKDYAVDWIVLAGFMNKISAEILDAYPGRIINIHPALLPKYGGKGMYGRHVHEAVVAAGEKESGITVHYVNEQYDEGTVIFQASCPVLPTDTPEDVAAKVHALEYEHYPRVIASLLSGEHADSFSSRCLPVFERATGDYHATDNVDAPVRNPFEPGTIESQLYLKNWIDAVQWHLEDLIRDPQIQPENVVALKRRIDRSNQERTDLVEQIDGYFLETYKETLVCPDATINTESPAWAVDRLSILILKIYHMRQEVNRPDTDGIHRETCQRKLSVLLEQKQDLSTALDQLLADIGKGQKYMKVYRQMKMYNDPSLNPILYGRKK
ncbi:MAG: phosphoribosylglycinamide formyltransferase [Tannerella sp.]|nr:phosphoribosylglycinamide formyltransferase [Tannerella sp.]